VIGRSARGALLLAAGLVARAAVATEGASDPPPEVSARAERLRVGGSVKSITAASFPREDALPLAGPGASGPSGQATVIGRLAVEARPTPALRIEVHPLLVALAPGQAAGGALLVQTGLGAPELVPLSWDPVDGPGLRAQLRLDRAVLRASLPGVQVAVGRQALSFGRGLFFTPLDLVNPFLPTVVDQEFKPGVDAARVDVFAGTSGQVTAAVAYGGPGWDDAVGALQAAGTLGVWDLGLMGAVVHEDLVAGAFTHGSVGPVGLHAEGAVTRPPAGSGQAPFVRAALGADARPHGNLSVSGELYVQSLGAATAAGYLPTALDPRFARGELWLLGRWYAAGAAAWQAAPTVNVALAAVVNLHDPSALLGPTLAWSVADDAELVAGAWAGLGAGPGRVQAADLAFNPFDPAGLREMLRGLPVRSEMGLLPTTGFLQLRAFF
jgi:hypothetical protein